MKTVRHIIIREGVRLPDIFEVSNNFVEVTKNDNEISVTAKFDYKSKEDVLKHIEVALNEL